MESLVLSLSKDEPLRSWSDKYILARRSWLDELTTSGESKGSPRACVYTVSKTA